MLNHRFFQLSFLVKLFFNFVLISFICLGLLACNNNFETTSLKIKTNLVPIFENKLSEVPPSDTIQLLSESLKKYHPKIEIVSPKPYEMLSDNNVSVKLRLTDYPLFKNEKLDLGPYLHLFVDKKSYKKIYDLSEPIILEDLDPGTHTIRVLVSRPWHESFKTKEAYAQTTFHIFTEIDNNSPDSSLPMLTYNSPQGDYGEEPIMLDFYISNLSSDPLKNSNINNKKIDWRVKATINGEAFILNKLEPIYLKGFKPGKNWIKLELIDKNGEKINNIFNDAIQLINYDPNKKDILSKLIQGGLSNQLAYSIIDPKFPQIPEIIIEEEPLPPQLKEITPSVESEEKFPQIPEIIIEEEPLPPQLKEITPSVENEKESQKNSNLSEQLT